MSPTVPLSELAHARSGDKGNHANIGVIACDQTAFEHLGRALTAERVAEYFAALAPSAVVRYELPGIRAYNFVLFDVLGGGASRSLRIDSQGKTLAVTLLKLPIPAP
ncbi:MAG: hypothetical protein KY476_11895 [Planctomycetes bacterium]|nr:hypothetical protein [Planctomycetota bacterium]